MKTPSRPARYPFVTLTAVCLALACGGNSKSGGNGGTSGFGGQASTESAMGGGGSSIVNGTGGRATGGASSNPTGGIPAYGGAGGNGSLGPGLAVFAGVPSGEGSADGTGIAARFTAPAGVAVDRTGNIFVADHKNHTIRKITPAGVVTTVAGTPFVNGKADGTGADARFDTPIGVAVDGTGNLFISDSYNHTIRKITPAGVVTTLAGMAGQGGSGDGVGTSARFKWPHGLTVDGAGNIFVADGNSTIRKVTPAGEVTTVAGEAGVSGNFDGTGANANFGSPAAVVVDGTGNLFVADGGNHNIRKITPAGVVTTIAGVAGESGSDDGMGTVARFNTPMGIALDVAGNLVVTSTFAIRRISPAGAVTTLAGASSAYGSLDGTGGEARFVGAQGIAPDGAGNFIVTDGNSVRKVTANGVVTTLAGWTTSYGMTSTPSLDTLLRQPAGLALDSTGNLFVADSGYHFIRKVSPAGVMSTFAEIAGLSGRQNDPVVDALFDGPQGVTLDAAGDLFVTQLKKVRKVTPDGVVTTLVGEGSRGGAYDQVNSPKGVAVDGEGNVFVADSSCIRKVTPAGTVTRFVGTSAQGSKDGTGEEASFSNLAGLVMDGTGNLFVADSGNHSIRKITPAGVVTTLAGTAGSVGTVDGMGTEARFNLPQDVAVDGAGNLFVADTNNHAIRKITPAGLVSTVVGVASPTKAGNVPGPLPGLLAFPRGVAVDPSGSRVYISLRDAIMVAVFSR